MEKTNDLSRRAGRKELHKVKIIYFPLKVSKVVDKHVLRYGFKSYCTLKGCMLVIPKTLLAGHHHTNLMIRMGHIIHKCVCVCACVCVSWWKTMQEFVDGDEEMTEKN